jgi:hypothetical protein
MATLDDSFILFSDGLYRNHISKHKWLNLKSVEVLAMRGIADKVYIMGKSRPEKNGNYTKSNPQILYSETFDAKTRELISCSRFSPPGEEKDYETFLSAPLAFSLIGFGLYAVSEITHFDKSGVFSLVSGLTSESCAIPTLVLWILKMRSDRGRLEREKLREKEKRFYRKLELIKRLSSSP